MGVGDRRLFEILVDAAAPAVELAFQLDRHPRAVVEFDPLDAVFFDVLGAGVFWRNILAFATAVQDLWHVALGVDLDFVVVGRLAGAILEMIFTGLPVVNTPYMPAALMPIPCWPRLIRRRWNFEP